MSNTPIVELERIPKGAYSSALQIIDSLRRELDDLKAKLAQVEAELAKHKSDWGSAKDAIEKLSADLSFAQADCAAMREAFKRERDRLREALETIASMQKGGEGVGFDMHDIAEAALKGETM